MARDLLAAPCAWCGHNGPNYWGVGSHRVGCPWRDVGGEVERIARLRDRVLTLMPLPGVGTPLDELLAAVGEFHRTVLQQEPREPGMLEGDELEHRLEFLREETSELEQADTVDGQADALVDLAYVALGGLVLMGVAPGAAFDAVHTANMRKALGHDASRTRDREGVDGAVKPDGWRPPNLDEVLSVHLADVLAAREPLFRDCSALRQQRGAQYNQGGVSLDDYFPYGHTSHAQMVHVKATRILAEMLGADMHPDVRDMAEHVRDLTNYLSFWYRLLTGRR